MPTPVISPSQPSFLQKDIYTQYPSQPSGLVALALPLPGMMPSIVPSASPDLPLRELEPSILPNTPKSIANIADEALRLSREALGLTTQYSLPKAGMSKMIKPEIPFFRCRDFIFPLRIARPASCCILLLLTLSHSCSKFTITDKASSQTAMLGTASARLNKFVRRLHDMLQSEKDSGVVEWRKGLLVLHSTDTFAKRILPKYFNTRNFKTFRRQLNYYGFVHVRSFSTTGSTTTALWVNQDLAKKGSDDIASVLMLKRVEPCEAAKTAEGRRVRKELAIHTVEEDLGVNAKTLQMEQIRSLANRAEESCVVDTSLFPSVPMEIQYTQSTGAHSVSSASNDDQPDLAFESADSSSSLSSSPPSDDESTSAANLLLLLCKVRNMA
jgi:hypothetical protein